MGYSNHPPYTNRELSWLDFNTRVLEEALDETVPLLERLKFISIVSSNLDEFFMVRIAGLKEQERAGLKAKDVSGMTASEQLSECFIKIRSMIDRQYKQFNKLLPKLNKKDINFTTWNQLTKTQAEYVNEYFEDIIHPVLTPLAIDAGRPFPFIANKTVNIAFRIENNGKQHYALIRLPTVLPRIIKIPAGLDNDSYMFIEEIIIKKAQSLFKGFTIKATTCFRLTRDADLSVDEDDAIDLLVEIEHLVKQRQWGLPVRLEIENKYDKNIYSFIMKSFSLSPGDIYAVKGPLDLSCLMEFTSMPEGFPELRNPDQPPLPSTLPTDKNIFELIAKKDYLIHHPYQSFDSVLRFLEQAASDPDVLAIKQALYRVSGDSPVIQALIKAAQRGKLVTVLVELKARFDEENNISWAKTLEKAGCHVIYGLAGLKIHSKILLIIRREKDGIKRYMHLGTGNYNDSTAKLYTDIGFFTSREGFASDMTALFNNLTGYTVLPDMKKLAVAPTGLRKFFEKAIQNEIKNARNGQPSGITAKVNSLSDPDIIKLLYEASSAGVPIKLIVRGICCLKPGLKNISSNIKVKSIVGRYLEHSRIYSFENGGNPLYYLSSADLMTRNLDRRIETLFPLEDEEIKNRLGDILTILWEETDKTRWLQSDGKYTLPEKTGHEAHVILYEYANGLTAETRK